MYLQGVTKENEYKWISPNINIANGRLRFKFKFGRTQIPTSNTGISDFDKNVNEASLGLRTEMCLKKPWNCQRIEKWSPNFPKTSCLRIRYILSAVVSSYVHKEWLRRTMALWKGRSEIWNVFFASFDLRKGIKIRTCQEVFFPWKSNNLWGQWRFITMRWPIRYIRYIYRSKHRGFLFSNPYCQWQFKSFNAFPIFK